MGLNQGTMQGHNINNYYIGKGILWIKLLGEPAYVDCGDAPEFSCMPKPTILDHYSSRTGVQTKDATFVTKKEATLAIILSDWSARNLAMCLMGSLADSPSGDMLVEILSQSIIQGAIKFVGDNDVGPRFVVTFPLVNFTPSKTVAFIGATLGTLDLQGDVLADDAGIFGTVSGRLADMPDATVPPT